MQSREKANVHGMIVLTASTIYIRVTCCVCLQFDCGCGAAFVAAVVGIVAFECYPLIRQFLDTNVRALITGCTAIAVCMCICICACCPRARVEIVA